jgi:hypothetical protein
MLYKSIELLSSQFWPKVEFLPQFWVRTKFGFINAPKFRLSAETEIPVSVVH